MFITRLIEEADVAEFIRLRLEALQTELPLREGRESHDPSLPHF